MRVEVRDIDELKAFVAEFNALFQYKTKIVHAVKIIEDIKWGHGFA